jgi:hypothetical protein
MDASLQKARAAFEREQELFEQAQEAYDHAERDAAENGEKLSAITKQVYEQAVARYQRARENYLPFKTEMNIATPPLARAAYSDRMAWIMANMANLAYIRFDKANDAWEDEFARLKFCLQSGRYDPDDENGEESKNGLVFERVYIFDTSEARTKGLKVTDTQAFLAISDSFAVLAFRGTQSDTWSDIWTDMRAVRRKTIDGKVHTGFQAAFDEIKDEIEQKLVAHLGHRPLYITGHSLGAALATVATRELEHVCGDQIAACYTFGSPLVGNGKYEKSIKVPFYRLVNPTDIVTLIPKFLWAYVHVGDVRYLSRQPELYRGMPTAFRVWEALLEMLVAALHLTNPFSPWVSHHNMKLYIKKLETIAIARQNLPRERPPTPGQLWL